MNPRIYSICTIEGCGLPHKGRGWCMKHYFRWKRYGDPNIVLLKISGRHELNRWLRNHIAYREDACLIWPFARMTNGYGLTRWRGRKDGAHRVMCELVYGPAPSSKHEAAHSCGRGTDGCVHPLHLRWATPKENNADKERHGTVVRGEQIPWSKLTADDVRSIRALFGTHSDIEIAGKFGVSDSAIYLIRKGQNWRHIR